jgi:PKD repeat protein/type IV secretory pathway VirB2 component (pilin)
MLKITKKLLSTGVIALVLASFMFLVPEISNGQSSVFCGGISDQFSGFADCGTQITSFSDFDGSLSLPDDSLNPTLTQDDNIKDFIKRIVNFALGFLGFIALIIVIYSGFQYVTALDNEEQMGKAKTNIKSVFIGIIIIFASYAIVNTALSIPSGEIGGSSIDGDNRAQLANYNSAATEVRSATVGYVRTYDQLLENTRKLALIKSYEPSDFTSRTEFVNYLNQVEDTLEDIGNEYDSISNTKLATTYVIDSVITPAKLIIQNQITREEVDSLQNEFQNSGLKNFADETLGGIGNFFAAGFSGEAKFEDYICSLPAAERPVNYDVKDCEQINTTNASGNAGSEITDSIRTYIDEVVYQRGLIVDYQRVVENMRETLDTLNDTASPYFVTITLQNGQTLSQTIDELIDVFSQNGSLYNIEDSLDPFANLGSNTTDADSFDIGFSTPSGGFDDLVKSNDVVEAVRKLEAVYNALVNVRFTAPVIATNVSRGNSPLVVTFDGSKSYDPAELSLNDENFEWDVDGDGDFDDYSSQSELVNCEGITSGPINLASITCTYKRPGTYRVGMRLTSSSEESQEVLPGIAYKTIRVTPPNAKIDLQVTPDNDNPIILQRYNQDDGTILLDRDEFTVTLNQAQQGLLFEADATGNKITEYSWRFSDEQGSISGSGDPILSNDEDPDTDIGGVQDDVKTIRKVFNSRGRYSGVLSVTDAQGQTDRKIFYVNVNTIVARVNADKINVNPGEEIVLDSSNSQSDFGPIVSREWSVDGLDQDFGSEEKITVSFQEPGAKSVGLKVRDGEGNEATVQVKINVESRPPTAVAIANALDKNNPSLVTLDGSQSSDPDVGDQEKLKYTWNFLGKIEGVDYNIVNAENVEKIEVQFLKKGTYTVKLTVTDPQGKVAEQEIQVTVNNIIDLAFGENQQYASQLDDNSTTTFYVESKIADTATIFFGDGSNQTGRFNNGLIEFEHQYKQAGAFDVRVEAEMDGTKKIITETFLVGAGSSPIGVITIEAYGNRYTKIDEMPAIYRDTILTFDASESLNIDGSNDNLLYSWDTGDGGKFTQKTFTYSYRDLPANPRGTFEIKLTVTNLNDRTQTNTRIVRLPVIRAFPTVQDVIVTPKGGPKTPFDIEVEAVGANDPDGNIKTFRYYYYPLSRSDEQIGVIASGSPRATMQIGTMGEEGQEVQYGICLDLVDDDGNEVKCRDIFNEGAAAIVTVVNGKNDLPTAKFRVDRTSINVGESVNFIDDSTDPDGEIVQWRYDFDGDGSFADEETYKKSTVEKVFTSASPIDGFKVKMEVTDDKGGRSVSGVIPIFVDSNLQPPTAAFRAEANGSEVEFVNNSRADQVNGGFIDKSIWDFDIQLDSDGDGNPSNDIDSTEYSPVFSYDRSGVYGVKLTVVDNEGNVDDVSNSFTLSTSDGIVSELAANDPDVGVENGSQTDSLGFPTLNIDGQEVDTYPSAPEVGLRNNAFLTTIPQTDRTVDAVISEEGVVDVTFKFSNLPTSVVEIKVDKNTYLDSGTDGIRNNDVDYVSTELNDFTTRYSSIYSPTRTLVTIKDNQGNVYTDFVDIRFMGIDFNASLSFDIKNNIPIFAYIVIISLFSLFSGIILRRINLQDKNKSKLY